MKLLVVIVNYGDDRNLKECLGSLSQLAPLFGGKTTIDVFVVNNGRNELKITNYKLRIKIIKTHRNLGFAAGVNRGLKMKNVKEYDWVWVLNPDTIIQNKEFTNLEFTNLDLNSGFDVWSPVIYQSDGRVWFAGGKLDKITGEPIIIRKEVENDGDCTWVSGCSMFVRPAVFAKIGLFDEKFFLFYEDVDFCLRAKKAGFKVGIVRDIPFYVMHKVSQSVRKIDGKEKYAIESKSKNYLIRKHWKFFWPTAKVISRIRSEKHKLTEQLNY